jgi:uncharacterized protein (DUF433 family)
MVDDPHPHQDHGPVTQPDTHRDEAVWIDPARHSGDPCIGGTRIPVHAVIEMVWRDGVDAATDTWSISRTQVLHACWYAAVINVVHVYAPRGGWNTRRGPWRARWGDWAEKVHGQLWHNDTADIPDPPRADG